ncbi:LLM class flavin-dependent oxidoreductase [Neobacillus rhizophilus]|uniref:LLM class flavin-dependent oxidoreductase n=1 Tax=Neobacillus rhizophilus TaxID=2833579 RepID=A0A942U4P2_9BACI|nr:LLM class flavin-dependent oxidoreductase [Neobacillus rhizophilus]MBS4214630.1 LLM class flavin-dependent oxidoreductase [Neobacillus rhizophilus]MBU8918532.1 LLM class flavin-dependent oxidoreductase [Bacillus sp. FJAT-29953]
MTNHKNEMSFGLFFLNSKSPFKSEDEELRNGLEQIKVADELGFHSAWMAEHNARDYGVVTSSTVYLAAAAAQTKRIKLGSAVARLPLHHPMQLAEEMTLVDVISNGRLYVGVGKGYDKLEFDAYNVDFDERHARFEESLDILKAALTNPRISYSGQFFNFSDIPINPRPIQQPGPPLFVMVSQNDASIINAAKDGYSFVLGGIKNDDTLHKISLYRETALAAGYSEDYVNDAMARSGKLLFVYVAETDEQAYEEFKEGLMWYMSERDNRPVFGVVQRDKVLDYNEFLKSENAIVGSPDKVRRDIEKFQKETGLNNIICWMNIGGQPNDRVIKSMNLFSKEVMPYFCNVETYQKI